MKWMAGLVVVPFVGFAILVGTFVLLVGTGQTPAAADCAAVLTADGSPTILGSASMTADAVTAWWTAAYGPTTPIGVPVATMVGYYQAHGDAENVRWDWAIAQMIVETFTGSPLGSPAAHRNNFAGIGITGSGTPGYDYPSPDVGVEAHIQLLRKVVSGNGSITEPNVSPGWGGKTGITTWFGLQGNWATSPTYWQAVSGWHAKMAGGAPVGTGTTAPGATLVGTNTCGGGAGPGCAQGNTNPSVATTTSIPGPNLDPLAAMWDYACRAMAAPTPYVWGGSQIGVGLDCSGLTQGAYAAVGVRLSHNAEIQFSETHGIVGFPQAQLQPGDLVFFGTPGNVHHVGIAVSTTSMLNAAHTGTFVRIEPFFSDYYGASRPSAMIPGKVAA